MADELARVLTLVVMVFGSQYGVGSGFRVVLSPDKINPMETDVVNVSCVLDRTATYVSSIQVMQINKEADDTVMAELREGSGITLGPKNNTNVKAEGQINSNVSDSSLTLSITNPSDEDAGVYTCSMRFTDIKGEFKDKKATGKLTAEKVNPRIYYIQMQDRVNKLEHDLIAQRKVFISMVDRAKLDVKSEMDSQIKTCCAQLSVLESKVKQLSGDLSGQNGKLQTLQKQVEDQADKGLEFIRKMNMMSSNTTSQLKALQAFVAKENKMYAFSAGYNRQGGFKGGDNVIFDDPLFTHGRGYDKHTGAFIAPTTGIYAFHLSVMTDDSDEALQTKIKANDKLLAETYSNGYKHFGHSSTSTVVKLIKGDVVRVVIGYVEYEGIKMRSFPWTLFTGYMVKALS